MSKAKLSTSQETKADVELTFRRCLGGVLRKVGHNRAMSDVEVKTLGNKIIGKKFIGVYARDEIDLDAGRPPGICFIVNNKPRTSGGEHWLAVYYKSNGLPILFDSFARRHILPEFSGDHTEDDVEQADWQEDCGQRCLAFLCTAMLEGDLCYWV